MHYNYFLTILEPSQVHHSFEENNPIVSNFVKKRQFCLFHSQRCQEVLQESKSKTVLILRGEPGTFALCEVARRLSQVL